MPWRLNFHPSPTLQAPLSTLVWKVLLIIGQAALDEAVLVVLVPETWQEGNPLRGDKSSHSYIFNDRD